ncbi:MAG TPA: glycosyltransferase [Thermohalobaculum sp.]|nr:glycosyltransferase [Thermohalobaculum sp.]
MSQYKIAILLPYELDTGPSQRYRWEQWAGHLEAEGLRIDLVSCSTPAIGLARRKGLSLRSAFLFTKRYIPWMFEALRAAWRADLVVVHRNAALTGPPIVEAIIAMLGKPLVYDLDDAIYRPPEVGDNFWLRLMRCDWRCGFIGARSALVGAGNPNLCDYMRSFNDNVVLWPTTVDTESYDLRAETDEAAIPVIGWTGSHSTAHYLEMILPALGELQRELLFEMLVIGAKVDLDAHGLAGRCVAWSAATEVALTKLIDIGLMPLADTEWARGKCALKAIQYLAFGTPAVVSDVGMNRDVVIDGENGFLIEPGGDWKPALRILLGDWSLRQRMGRKGRAHVVAHYSADVVANTIARDLRRVLEDSRQDRRSGPA